MMSAAAIVTTVRKLLKNSKRSDRQDFYASCSQLLNVMFRRVLSHLDMKQVGCYYNDPFSPITSVLFVAYSIRAAKIPIQPSISSKGPVVSSGKFPNIPETKNPSPSAPPAPTAVPYANKSPPILPFQENPSWAGKPSTASSTFTLAVDEQLQPTLKMRTRNP